MLKREIGTTGAMFMGLGSMIGTGVFVSIGLCAEKTGVLLLFAVPLAGLVALCNALSSAQLAARFPVSGGTYEYANRLLNGPIGFAAGWMFICAKSASAATAALGLAGYLLNALQWEGPDSKHVILAVSVLIVPLSLVLFGIRQSNQINSVVVSITLCALSLLIMAGVTAVLILPDFSTLWNAVLSQKFELDSAGNTPHDFSSLSFTSVHWSDFLEATALMFVAFTGYGRIATLGEEVKRPRTTIPRAIAITMLISVLVYMGISFTALSTLGTERLYRATMEQAAPLEIVARQLETAFANQPGLWRFLPAGILTAAILVGAITAMTGVLLNLLLGLSRVLLAMGRRKDLPVLLTRVHPENGAPRPAILVTGGIVLLLVLIGSVKLAWTFSALTVLFYYGITNLAALRLQPSERLYPAWVSICGLIGCLFLVVFIDGRAWLAGAIILAIGFGIRSLSNFYQNR